MVAVETPRASAHATGTNNIIVQAQGGRIHVTVGLPHLTLIRPANRAPLSPPKTEIDLLNPYRRSIPLVGRARDMASLWEWLSGPPRISVRVVTGRAGSGKTRAAIELIEKVNAEKPGVWAGFVNHGELRRFAALHDLADWGWGGPTLIVVDYAVTVRTPRSPQGPHPSRPAPPCPAHRRARPRRRAPAPRTARPQRGPRAPFTAPEHERTAPSATRRRAAKRHARRRLSTSQPPRDRRRLHARRVADGSRRGERYRHRPSPRPEHPHSPRSDRFPISLLRPGGAPPQPPEPPTEPRTASNPLLQSDRLLQRLIPLGVAAVLIGFIAYLLFGHKSPSEPPFAQCVGRLFEQRNVGSTEQGVKLARATQGVDLSNKETHDVVTQLLSQEDRLAIINECARESGAGDTVAFAKVTVKYENNAPASGVRVSNGGSSNAAPEGCETGTDGTCRLAFTPRPATAEGGAPYRLDVYKDGWALADGATNGALALTRQQLADGVAVTLRQVPRCVYHVVRGGQPLPGVMVTPACSGVFWPEGGRWEGDSSATTNASGDAAFLFHAAPAAPSACAACSTVRLRFGNDERTCPSSGAIDFDTCGMSTGVTAARIGQFVADCTLEKGELTLNVRARPPTDKGQDYGGCCLEYEGGLHPGGGAASVLIRAERSEKRLHVKFENAQGTYKALMLHDGPFPASEESVGVTLNDVTLRNRIDKFCVVANGREGGPNVIRARNLAFR